MIPALVLLLISLAVAGAIVAIALFGRRGANTDSAIGQQFAQVGRHLNGEAEAPQALANLITKHS